MIARYLTHPEVTIDPNIPVTDWGLNEVGHGRIRALIASNILNETTFVVSSGERKARDTAEPIALNLGATLTIAPGAHENDRSATGYLPLEEFEATADAFFEKPETSVRGWETAVAAQTRIVAEVNKALKTHTNGDILFVGHGAVGTLLYCHLARRPISRKLDQFAGGGCLFSFDVRTGTPLDHWRRIEDLL